MGHCGNGAYCGQMMSRYCQQIMSTQQTKEMETEMEIEIVQVANENFARKMGLKS